MDSLCGMPKMQNQINKLSDAPINWWPLRNHTQNTSTVES